MTAGRSYVTGKEFGMQLRLRSVLANARDRYVVRPLKKAVTLAAGFGSHVRPLTGLRPKPLVDVNGTPILQDVLRSLEAVGVEEVTIVVGYRKVAVQYACGYRFGPLRSASDQLSRIVGLRPHR